MMKKYAIILFLLLVSCNVYSQDIFGTAKNKDTTYLDPNDFTTGQYIAVDTVGGNKVFVGKQVSNIEAATKYQYLRATLFQDSTVNSGKIRMLSPFGGGTVNLVTFADNYSLSGSYRVSRGIYMLQFKTNNDNSFSLNIATSLSKETIFERKVYPIFGHYVPAIDPEDPDVWVDELVGYLVMPCNITYGDFDLGNGRLLAKTYDVNWVLKDGILKDGYTIEFKAFIE